MLPFHCQLIWDYVEQLKLLQKSLLYSTSNSPPPTEN